MFTFDQLINALTKDVLLANKQCFNYDIWRKGIEQIINPYLNGNPDDSITIIMDSYDNRVWFTGLTNEQYNAFIPFASHNLEHKIVKSMRENVYKYLKTNTLFEHPSYTISFERACKKFRQHNDKLKVELDTLYDAYEDTHQENSHLNNIIQNQKSEIQRLTSEVEKLKREVSLFKIANQHLQGDVKELKGKVYQPEYPYQPRDTDYGFRLADGRP